MINCIVIKNLLKTFAFGISLLFNTNLLACKCPANLIESAQAQAQYIYAAADNVFLIKVTRSVPTGKTQNDITTLHYFEILDQFKGLAESFPFLQSGSDNPTSCNDDGLIVDRIYLVLTDTKIISDCSVITLDLEADRSKNLLSELAKQRDGIDLPL